MINYAVDSNFRTYVYVCIMGVSALLNIFITWYIPIFQSSFFVTFATAPTAFAIFSVLFYVFDNYWWKLKVAGVPLSIIPDLSGEWVGYIMERHGYVAEDNHYILRKDQYVATKLLVSQSFRRISLRFWAVNVDDVRGRESEATSAAMILKDETRPKLIYTYTRQDLSGSSEIIMKKESGCLVLEGSYTSNRPRVGVIRLMRCETNDIWECLKIDVIPLKGNRNYLGVYVQSRVLDPFIQKMTQYLPDDQFAVYRDNQHRRDDGAFHITLIEPAEYKALGQEKVQQYLPDVHLWVQFIGLGKAVRGEDEVFFCVVNCIGAQQIRSRLGLGAKDLHVTLGFKANDIHGVAKGTTSIVR